MAYSSEPVSSVKACASMKDIASARMMWLKAGIFLLLGVLSGALLLVEAPRWKTGVLLALAVWSFCRAYYFAFYVIEHYVDSDYRFSGLVSFLRYLLHRR